MSIPVEVVEEYAKALVKAEDTQTPIEPITTEYPEITIEEAYKIQLKVIEEKTRRGEKIIGKKIGLTSKAMQQLGGIYEPDYGFLTDKMIAYEDFPVKRSEFINPGVEAEIAFVLKEDIVGPGVIVSDVLQATDYVLPCLEIIDRRTIRRPVRRVENSILDNAAVGKVIFGAKKTKLEGIDLRLVGLVFEYNGEIVSTASGAAVYGNPVQAVAWLANKLADFGVSLKKGETIISGSLIAAVRDVKAGDIFYATFDRLGSVKVKFIE